MFSFRDVSTGYYTDILSKNESASQAAGVPGQKTLPYRMDGENLVQVSYKP